MLAENVAAACLAPFAMTVRCFVVTPDVFRPLGDLHRLWFPQRESIDWSCRPMAARLAVAITHRFRFAAYREPHRAAKTAAVVRFFLVCHDFPPYLIAMQEMGIATVSSVHKVRCCYERAQEVYRLLRSDL
jgi:hypothetical protein